MAPSKSFTVQLSLTLIKAGVPVPRVGKTAKAAQAAVSVTDCCVTNYHKCGVLKHSTLLAHSSVVRGLAWHVRGLCSGYQRLTARCCLGRFSSYPETLRKNLLPNQACCWQNSVPCGYTS